jgi:hypothetical protein
MGTDSIPTNDEWKRLLSAVQRYQEAAPWRLLSDSDLIGVRDPETGVVGYCCIMGGAGEVFGMNLYLGGEGYASYLALAFAAEIESGVMMTLAGLSQKCLAFSLEDRRALGPQDRQGIKNAGITIRGAGNWPLFRSYDPGLEPWPLSGLQARFLATALEQAVDVGERFRTDPQVLRGPQERDRIRVRVATPGPEELRWGDAEEAFEAAASVSVSCHPQLLEALARLPAAVGLTVEVAHTFLPGLVKPAAQVRGFYAHLLMLVDSTHGLILGHDLMELEDFPDRLVEKLVGLLVQLGRRPASLRVCDPFLYAVLTTLLADLGIQIEAVPALPQTEEAFAGMSGAFKRR